MIVSIEYFINFINDINDDECYQFCIFCSTIIILEFYVLQHYTINKLKPIYHGPNWQQTNH